MGILNKLKDEGTLMKLLKYGADTQGGGNSGQPFIQKEIPENYIPKEGEDQILRGGFKAPINAATDVLRLTKYLFNPKSTNGVLFVAKQNILSQLSPKTETSGLINGGVYTPLSTLAQVGVGFAGSHLYKQGLNPFEGLAKYGEIVFNKNRNNFFETNSNNYTNRLLEYYNDFLIKEQNTNLNISNLTDYSGGPGSILGIGKTYIKFATDGGGSPLRTGIQNKDFENIFEERKLIIANSTDGSEIIKYENGVEDLFNTMNSNSTSIIFSSPNGQSIFGSKLSRGGGSNNSIRFATDRFGSPLRTGINNPNYIEPSIKLEINKNQESNIILYTGYRSSPFFLTKISDLPSTSSFNPSPISNILGPTGYKRENTSPISFKEGNTWYATSNGIEKLGDYSSYKTLYNDELLNFTSYPFGIKPNDLGYLANQDRNAGTYYDGGGKVHKLNYFPRGINQDFRNVPRHLRGFKDETQGEIEYNDNILKNATKYLDESAKPQNTVDQIYYSSTVSSFKTSTSINSGIDLIQFRIEILDVYDPINGNEEPPLYFRAYIDNLSDSYNPEWSSQTYMGRGEKFYRFKSFDRDISLGFTIVADNRTNLDKMYEQLNTLAASLTPNYGNSGYMAGNIHKLTIGNYISNQYGIIQGLTYDISNETPWEISSGDQLPLYIKVTGLKFTPIHNFRPEYQPAASPQFINQLT